MAEPRFSFLGGAFCLDFCNTVDWHTSDSPEDRLHAYGDLVAWGREAGLLDGDAASRLLQVAEHRGAEAAVWERAVAMREAMFRLFLALSRQQRPGPADLDRVNEAVGCALSHARLVPQANGFAWGWEESREALDCLLWPVARSAADLLTSPDLSRLRLCDGPGCGWLFLDTTRNRSRRWCSMQDCGNRAKARRFLQRQRAGRQPDEA